MSFERPFSICEKFWDSGAIYIFQSLSVQNFCCSHNFSLVSSAENFHHQVPARNQTSLKLWILWVRVQATHCRSYSHSSSIGKWSKKKALLPGHYYQDIVRSNTTKYFHIPSLPDNDNNLVLLHEMKHNIQRQCWVTHRHCPDDHIIQQKSLFKL